MVSRHREVPKNFGKEKKVHKPAAPKAESGIKVTKI